MKVLFILGAYKPRASANGLCASNIIAYLKSKGHAVTVISNQNMGCTPYKIEEDIPVYRVKQRLYLRLKERADALSPAKPVCGWLMLLVANVVNKLQLIATVLSWPVISRRTNRRFENMAKKLQKENNYDVVISVYTPIEALLAGYAVKKEYPQVKFVPYFLDSLSGGYGPKFFSEEQTRNRGLKIENKVFEAADAIVLMKSSEEHQKKYNHPFCKKMVFLDIPMLVKPKDTNLLNDASINTAGCKLLFVGSIAKNIRPPRTLINALACVDREDILCEFVGNIDCIEEFSALKEKMGERLIFSGFMDHDKLMEKIAEANILINIGNRVSTMVPSKIFEYMSFTKPIISTYDIENEPSTKYLRAYPAALLLSGCVDPEKNAACISDFIDRIGSMTIDFNSIEKQFYLNTPGAFDQVFDKLFKE